MLFSLIGIAFLLIGLTQVSGSIGFLLGLALVGLTSSAMWQAAKRHWPQPDPTAAPPVAEQLNYFQEFVDRLPIPVFIKDSESSTIYVNLCYETIFGSGWVGKSVWDFFPETIARQMVDADRKALHSGTKEILETVPVPDGTGRLFQTIKFPLYQEGKPVMLAGFGVDITQRRLAETTLERMNAKLTISNTELEYRNHKTQLLLEFSTALQCCHTFADITTAITQFISQLLPQYAGLVAIKLPDRTSLQVVTTWGLPTEVPDLQALPCHSCWLWKCPPNPCVAQSTPGGICSYWHGENSVYYACVPAYDATCDAGTDDAGAAPTMMGMMHFYLPTGAPIPELALQLAQSILMSINQTLVNVTLRQSLQEQSMRDPLTNLFNRRYLQETLVRELAQASRNQTPVSLLVLDIDRFKQINDTYGHTVGDIVLKRLGALLQHHTRQGDIACRYGGEEFVVVLPMASVENAYRRAEEIRCAFAEQAIASLDVVVQATVSIGIAAYPHYGLEAEAIFCAADAALYQAKANGRNQTVISSQFTRSPTVQPLGRHQTLREKDRANDDQQAKNNQTPIPQKLGKPKR